MNGKDFIKKYIITDEDITTDKQFLSMVEKYKKYAYYLDLLTKVDVKIIFKEIIKFDVICKHKLTHQIIKHKFDYYINILLNEKLIKYCCASEHLEKELKDFLGKYNFSKMGFYCLTNKGQDFISSKNIKEYLK